VAEIDNVAILQAVWGGIQRRHPDVPDVVIDIRVLQVHPDGTVPPAAYFIPAPVPTVVVTDWAVVSPRGGPEVPTARGRPCPGVRAGREGRAGALSHEGIRGAGRRARSVVDESDVEPFGRGGGYNVTHLDAGTADEYAEELRLLATAEEQVGR
jgi:hypothetical protein